VLNKLSFIKTCNYKKQLLCTKLGKLDAFLLDIKFKDDADDNHSKVAAQKKARELSPISGVYLMQI